MGEGELPWSAVELEHAVRFAAGLLLSPRLYGADLRTLGSVAFAAGGVGVTVGFLRRRRAPPEASDRPPGPRAAPPGDTPKRSLFRRAARGTAPEPASRSPAAQPPVPEYFEGPPEPAPTPPSHGRRTARATGGPETGGAPADLDALLAQLDQLSEQIRRRPPARPSKSPPDEPDRPPSGN